MSLKNWQLNGWLTAHMTSPQEMNDLLAVAERDLQDCTVPGLSADWRLNIAYNAALQAATAALAACGYRAVREADHFRVIQSLVYTIELLAAVVTQFDFFRKKRNIGGYERAGMVSDHEADAMLTLAKEILRLVAGRRKCSGVMYENRLDTYDPISIELFRKKLLWLSRGRDNHAQKCAVRFVFVSRICVDWMQCVSVICSIRADNH